MVLGALYGPLSLIAIWLWRGDRRWICYRFFQLLRVLNSLTAYSSRPSFLLCLYKSGGSACAAASWLNLHYSYYLHFTFLEGGLTRPRDYVSAADGSFMRYTFLLDLGSSMMRLGDLSRLLHSQRFILGFTTLFFGYEQTQFFVTFLQLEYLGTWLCNTIGAVRSQHTSLIEISHFSFYIFTFALSFNKAWITFSKLHAYYSDIWLAKLNWL